MSEEKFGERIAVVEQKVDGLEGKVNRLESANEALIELKTIVKMQAETNIAQNKTLEKINDNLTELNISQSQLKNEMSQIGNRVQHIEDTQESHKVDVPKLMTKIFIGIAMISVALLSAYLMKVTGLK